MAFGTATRFYARQAPSPEAAVRIFKGEWSCRLPPPLDRVTGAVGQFDDATLAWAIRELGDLHDASVLELGPLEAGHTYMLHAAGAQAITAVEGNSRAYLRCLVVKELYDLRRARFLHGDFVEHLRSTADTYDVCVASGVLYHVLDPVELLSLAARAAPRLYLWTQYHDPSALASRPRLRRRMTGSERAQHDGFEHTLHRHEYGYSLRRYGFSGGSGTTSSWLSREDLLAALDHVGYTDRQIAYEDRSHPNGAAIAILAARPSA